MSTDDELDRRVRCRRVLGEMFDEQTRQHAKWGEQNHPDLSPAVAGLDPVAVARYYGIPTAAEAKHATDSAAAAGTLSWVSIALEELAELVEALAAGDVDEARLEAVQTGAVMAQWVAAIDRRRARA